MLRAAGQSRSTYAGLRRAITGSSEKRGQRPRRGDTYAGRSTSGLSLTTL